ncbi:MAG: DUF1838 family protein [Rhodospirillaceae bacterium]|nr:DUF1838 family protein [Rhodospirillaceae bacterium]
MERRSFLAATAATGLGSAAASAATGAAPSLTGPYIDLTTGKGTMLALARMDGNLDETKVKYGGASGIVSAVRANEKVRDLFGFEVLSVGQTRKQADGSYRILHRETIFYTDLATGDVLSEYRNPFTDETVKVVDVINDPWNLHIEEFEPRPPSYGGLNKIEDGPRKPHVLNWREIGGGLVTALRNINLFYPSALQPEQWPRESAGKMAQVSETYTFVVKLADLQNPDLTSVTYGGSWSRVTPWLPWLLMGQAPGHIVYHSTTFNGDDLKYVKPKVVAHAQKHHPHMLEPPSEDSVAKPNLSSLENYARTQKPAPVPKS